MAYDVENLDHSELIVLLADEDINALDFKSLKFVKRAEVKKKN